MTFIYLLLLLLLSIIIICQSIIESSSILYNQNIITIAANSSINNTNTNTNTNTNNGQSVYSYNLTQPHLLTNKTLTKINNLPLSSTTYTKLFTVCQQDQSTIYVYQQPKLQYLLPVNTTMSSFYILNPDNSTLLPSPEINNNSPIQRSGSSIIITKDNQLYLFGGYIKHPNYSQLLLTRQFYHFNFTSNQWIDLTYTTDEAKIPPSAYHTATLIEDRYMVILGGSINLLNEDGRILYNSNITNELNKPFNLIYLFDIQLLTWKKIIINNAPTEARIGHTTTYFKNKKQLIIYGGLSNCNNTLQLTSDLYLLNLTSWQMESHPILNYDNTPSNLKLAFHSALLIQNNYFLFFGQRDSNQHYIKDFYVINTDNWQHTTTINSTLPIKSSHMRTGVTQSNNNNDNTRELLSPTDKLVLAIVMGIIGGILLSGLLLLISNYYKKNRITSPNLDQISFLQLPPDSNSSFPNLQFNHSQSNLWDLDSQYAYSTYLNHTLLNFNTSGFKGQSRQREGERENTLVNTRRWSLDEVNIFRLKRYSEVIMERYEEISLMDGLDETKVMG